MQRIGSIETELTKKIKGKGTSNWVCPGCSGTKTQYTLRIINTGKKDFNFPQWVPQIKESCINCGRYRRFAPQSEILIKRWNDRLAAISIPAKGRDFHGR